MLYIFISASSLPAQLLSFIVWKTAFQGLAPYHLGDQIGEDRSQFSFIILSMSLVFFVMSSLSLLISEIWSSFLLTRLEAYQYYRIFQRISFVFIDFLY